MRGEGDADAIGVVGHCERRLVPRDARLRQRDLEGQAARVSRGNRLGLPPDHCGGRRSGRASAHKRHRGEGEGGVCCLRMMVGLDKGGFVVELSRFFSQEQVAPSPLSPWARGKDSPVTMFTRHDLREGAAMLVVGRVGKWVRGRIVEQQQI